MFGLKCSLRRVSVDLPAYIAEGSMKTNAAEFAKSVSVALGFANRLEYYALLARDLTFFGVESHSSYEGAIIEVKKMLNKFGGQLRRE